jgi:hypothetical protein
MHLLGAHRLAQHFPMVLFGNFVGVFAAGFLAFVGSDVFRELLRLLVHLFFNFLTIFLFEVDFEAFGISILIILQFLICRRVLRILNAATFCQVARWNVADDFHAFVAVFVGL